jgi:DNA-directed RNA polymerase specialized sigma subunit
MMLVATMWSEGMSDPTLASDTLIVNGLTEIGVSTEDARDYSLLGCQEIEIPGKSNFGCEDGSFNVAKVLEYIRDQLDEREKKIIIMRYGLGNTKNYTQREVADILGISRSYVSRIEKSVLEKINKYLSCDS